MGPCFSLCFVFNASLSVNITDLVYFFTLCPWKSTLSLAHSMRPRNCALDFVILSFSPGSPTVTRDTAS